jgi:hypothetical protein
MIESLDTKSKIANDVMKDWEEEVSLSRVLKRSSQIGAVDIQPF